jgi:Cys-tRNA synthase (O-phospho-L-seryl-tRNA:Cys-tRNA synthase)
MKAGMKRQESRKDIIVLSEHKSLAASNVQVEVGVIRHKVSETFLRQTVKNLSFCAKKFDFFYPVVTENCGL